MRSVAVLCSGLLFGCGLVISGMHDPAVVQGFLDPLGQWDPSLALVMAGAVSVTFVGYRIVLGKKTPVFNAHFALPTRSDIDRSLVAGAAMFGVGWGLVGLCPGPAVVSIAAKTLQTLPFFAAMIIGLYLPKLFKPNANAARSHA